MSGGWGCPHDDRGTCVRRDAPCDPGSEGCVLEEAFRRDGPGRDEDPQDQSTCRSRTLR